MHSNMPSLGYMAYATCKTRMIHVLYVYINPKRVLGMLVHAYEKRHAAYQVMSVRACGRMSACYR